MPPLFLYHSDTSLRARENHYTKIVSHCQHSMTQLMSAMLTALLHYQESVRGLKNRRVIIPLNGQCTIIFFRDPVGLKVSSEGPHGDPSS